MLELNEPLQQALDNRRSEPVRVVDPRTQQTYVLVPAEVYKRLVEDYDDSPWTDEEMEALAWEAGKHAGWWEDMPEYDNYPEKQ